MLDMVGRKMLLKRIGSRQRLGDSHGLFINNNTWSLNCLLRKISPIIFMAFLEKGMQFLRQNLYLTYNIDIQTLSPWFFPLWLGLKLFYRNCQNFMCLKECRITWAEWHPINNIPRVPMHIIYLVQKIILNIIIFKKGSSWAKTVCFPFLFFTSTHLLLPIVCLHVINKQTKNLF